MLALGEGTAVQAVVGSIGPTRILVMKITLDKNQNRMLLVEKILVEISFTNPSAYGNRRGN